MPRLLEFKPWKTRKIVSVAPGDGRYCCCEAIMWVTHKFDSRALRVGLPKMNELHRDGFMVFDMKTVPHNLYAVNVTVIATPTYADVG